MQDNNSEFDPKLMYGNEGKLRDWGRLDPLTQQDALLTAQMLKRNQVIPAPKAKGEKIVILSPSSNVGFYEAMIKAAFGNEYIVIAGDIAEVERFKHGEATHVQLDANLLPFPNQSLHVIFDRQGALWHAAYADLQARTTVNTSRLFEEYHKKLQYGGLLITDQQVIAKLPTAPMIDRVYQNKRPTGFMNPYTVGEANWQYRVYRNL